MDTHLPDRTDSPTPPSRSWRRSVLGLVLAATIFAGGLAIGMASSPETPELDRAAADLGSGRSTTTARPRSAPASPSSTTSVTAPDPTTAPAPSPATTSTTLPGPATTTTSTTLPAPGPTTTTTSTTLPAPAPDPDPSSPPPDPADPENEGGGPIVVKIPSGILAPKLNHPSEVEFGAQFVANFHIHNPGIFPVTWSPGPSDPGVSWNTVGGTIQPGTGMTAKISVTTSLNGWTKSTSISYGGTNHPVALKGFHLGPQDQGVKIPALP